MNTKKRIYRLLTVVIALCLMSALALPSFAMELTQPGALNGDIISEQENIETQLLNYLRNEDKTDTQKSEAIQKIELLNKIYNGDNIPQRRYTANTLPVPFYSQENSYYCGPATVKQTLQYLNGSSPSQSSLASLMGTTSTSGTDTNRICSYLNANTSRYYSVIWSWPNAGALSQMVVTNIDKAQPIVAHVIINSTSSGWPYTTAGHYMNYNGYGATSNIFYVTDPFSDRYGYSNGKYGVSNVAAQAVTDRMIW